MPLKHGRCFPHTVFRRQLESLEHLEVSQIPLPWKHFHIKQPIHDKKKKVPILLQTSSAQVFRDTNTVSHPHTRVAELASCTMSSRPWHYTHRSYHRADCNPTCESPREGDVAAAFWERYKWLDTGAGLQTKELLWFLELRKFLELLLLKKKKKKTPIK